jgi:hypothetical protein
MQGQVEELFTTDDNQADAAGEVISNRSPIDTLAPRPGDAIRQDVTRADRRLPAPVPHRERRGQRGRPAAPTRAIGARHRDSAGAFSRTMAALNEGLLSGSPARSSSHTLQIESPRPLARQYSTGAKVKASECSRRSHHPRTHLRTASHRIEHRLPAQLGLSIALRVLAKRQWSSRR